jgi:hypothetical protein
MPLLPIVLTQTRAQPELMPARTSAEFATYLAPPQTKDGCPSPLLGMMGRSDRSTVPRIPRHNQRILVARRGATRSTPLLVINATYHLGFLRATYAGKGQDQRVAERAGAPLPAGSGRYPDMGFQGCILTESPLV